MTVNFGSIGLGMGASIGAAVALQHQPTLLVTGDGGFMLGGLGEFSTAVRNDLDLIAVVVCNDGSYGAEHVQYCDRGMDPRLALFDWPDFAEVARAMGGDGMTIRTPGDLDLLPAVVDGRRGPLLLDVKLDPETIPRHK